jgi:hypothetical protein
MSFMPIAPNTEECSMCDCLKFWKTAVWPCLAALAAINLGTINPCHANNVTDEAYPNIVLIMTDDQGYSDIGCFGARGFETPHLDRLAAQGRRFTDFYVAASVCTASRAALMTGCYPMRVSMFGALNHTSREGIHPDELLLSEVLQQKGYATACYGKWHRGTVVEFSPTRNGFDEFFGIPYSNDNSACTSMRVQNCRPCAAVTTNSTSHIST